MYMHQKITAGKDDQHVVRTKKLGGAMLPLHSKSSHYNLKTLRKKGTNIKTFATKVMQRQVAKICGSCLSQSDNEMLSSRSRI